MLILNTVAVAILLALAGIVEANANRYAELARTEAIAKAPTGCLHSQAFEEAPEPFEPRQALLEAVVATMGVPEYEPYALPCVDQDRSVDPARFVDGLVTGMSFDDARCFAGAPAPVRIEHVHAPKFPSVKSRRSIQLIAHERDGSSEARLEPLRSFGWILQPAGAPMARELDAMMTAAQTCEDAVLHASPGMRTEVAFDFTIGATGRATELELLGPSRRELVRLRSHFDRGPEMVMPAEVRACIAGAVRATRFELPPGIDRVEVTAAAVAMLLGS